MKGRAESLFRWMRPESAANSSSPACNELPVLNPKDDPVRAIASEVDPVLPPSEPDPFVAADVGRAEDDLDCKDVTLCVAAMAA